MTTNSPTPDPETQRAEVELADDALDALLKMQDDLRASMEDDPDGHDFKDGEIERLIVLSASVTHLVRDLRTSRTAHDTVLAQLAEAVERVQAVVMNYDSSDELVEMGAAVLSALETPVDTQAARHASQTGHDVRWHDEAQLFGCLDCPWVDSNFAPQTTTERPTNA